MAGIPSPFSGSNTGAASGHGFDPYDSFDPAGVPEPGPFLESHEVLAGREHAAFHRLTRRLFDERGVYDATFGYNLARLNLDRRHPGAGYRYAVETDQVEGRSDHTGSDCHNREEVLRAEFTPTTPFCPQSQSLAIGSVRAWNANIDRHEYDLVRVRVHPMHHRSEAINAELAALEPDTAAKPVSETQGESSSAPDHDAILRTQLSVGDGQDTNTDGTEPSHGTDLSKPF
jgi:hypothetical protein